MSDFSSIFTPKSASDILNLTRAPFDSPTAGDSPLSAQNSQTFDGTLAGNDLFFRFLPLSKTDFNKSYGYEMWIWDVKTDTQVAEYIFPLNPQNISINVPTATVLEATMKGVYETHNGAPFRPIAISGTTGINVIPLQAPSNASDSSDLRRSVEYAFKNTIQSVSSLVTQAKKTINAFSGANQSFSGPLNYKVTEINNLHTGYESIHDLSRFLDYYLAGKKQSQNKSWRLYFIMNKDKQYYACSLQNYSIVKSAGTLEYQYSINMTAYRREYNLPGLNVKPKGLISKINAGQTSNTLSNIINGINQARTTVADANRVMSGIRADINDSFIAPVGQIALLGKDLLGLGKTMYDFAFSGQTMNAMKESFKQYFTDNKSTSQSLASAVGALGLTGALTPIGKPVSALDASAQAKLSSGKAEQFIDSADTSDPLQQLFDRPADYPQIFDQIPIDAMNLPAEITDQLDTITNTTLQFTPKDLITMRDKMLDFSTSISSALGGASASYNKLKGLGTPPKTFKKLTVQDIVLLAQLNEICIQTDRFIAMMDISGNSNAQDYYQYYSDYAVTQGIKFNSDNLSRFFIPFPRNSTLEQLAAQYLGDSDRWIEIAALNALKAPYVDEVGYDITVIASAGGDTLTVGDAGYLYIGQVVSVMSDTVQASLRKVSGIDIVSEAQTLITFETIQGSPLTAYKPSANARINASMPNTVNSNMLIAIPSPKKPTFQTTFKTSPEVSELNGIARIAKIDILLDQSGDIIISGGGEVGLAAGYTNLVQAAQIKLQTKTRQILNLPSFGNPVDAGISTADVSASDILKALDISFRQDPRFTGVLAGEVQITGPAVVVSILVGIANSDVTLPVSAELPR